MKLKATLYIFITLVIVTLSGCLSENDQTTAQDAAKQESTSIALNSRISINEMVSEGDVQGLAAAINHSDKDIRLEAAKAFGKLMAGNGSKEDPDIALKIFGVYEKKI